MVKVYVALGSNLNEPIRQLDQAIKKIQKFAKNLRVSSFYGSKPLGPQDQPDYVNAVVEFETDLMPLALLDQLQRIENEQGRVRLRHWGERTLDLDILLYGNEQIHIERLIVPHYDMENREFVMVPLFELAPDLHLPNGDSVADLAKRFQFHQMVKIQ